MKIKLAKTPSNNPRQYKGDYEFNWEYSYIRYLKQYEKFMQKGIMAEDRGAFLSFENYKKEYKRFIKSGAGKKSKNVPRDIAKMQLEFSYGEALRISGLTDGKFSVHDVMNYTNKTYIGQWADEDAPTEHTANSPRQALYLKLKFEYGEEEAEAAFGYV